jgi:UDP-2-acetamido-3-amino-2,3-dideoxy-glucuronate N-acetyltransferase
MSRHGHVLRPGADGVMRCPESQLRYREVEPGVLRCLDLDEDAPMPAEMAVGKFTYGDWKSRAQGRSN